MEQVQLAAQLAVVALLGLLQHGEVVLQVFLVGPGRAVHALQHLVAVVAPPVGAGHLHELEYFELAGGRHMRPATQVDPLALAIQTDGLVRGNAGDDLGLVVLAQAFEVGHCLIARQHTAHHRFVLGGQLGHALFDRGQVVGGEGALVRKVVIKAVVDHRADGDLRLREQFLDGVGQQVGGGVADQLQAIGVFGGDDGQGSVLLDAKAGVHQLAIHLAAQRGFGEASTNGGGHLGHRDRAGKFTLRTVGERDVQHEGSRKQKARHGPRC